MPGRRCPRRGLLRGVTHACRLRPRANPCRQAGQGGQTQGNPEKAEMEKTELQHRRGSLVTTRHPGEKGRWKGWDHWQWGNLKSILL